MYTLLLDETNKLTTTIKERIMQRSKLVDDLHFLVDPIYKGHNMSDFTPMLEYILPVSREYKSEILVKSDELYKDRLEYKLPFDTCLTKEAGDIEIQLTFVKVALDSSGKSVQRVRKTSPATITIVPISAWSDIIADGALTALDQRLIQTQAMLEAINDMNQALYETKADNIYYDEAGQYIQLTANGNLIGDKIVLNLADNDVCVKYVKVDESGELIVTYSDGKTESAGKVVEDVVSGIYIPDVSKDGMLTMTLSQKVGEPSYTWDIDRSNDWNEIEGVESSTNYFWEEL
jgi:hypothetical protein